MITAQLLRELMFDCIDGNCRHESCRQHGYDEDEYWDGQLEILSPAFAQVFAEGQNSGFSEKNPYEGIPEPQEAFAKVADAEENVYYRTPLGIWRHEATDHAVDWENIKAARRVCE